MQRLFFIALFLLLPLSALGADSVGPAVIESSLKRDLRDYFSKKFRPSTKLKLGFSVLSLDDGEEIFSYRGKDSLVPASALKIVTTGAALQLLGPEYRFPTEMFTDRRPNRGAQPGQVGNLYVRGYGDPSLVVERLWQMASQLKFLGVREVDDLVIDDTLFIDPPAPSGHKAYQAGLSAISLNHNSYAIHVAPTRAGAAPLVHLSPGLEMELINKARTVSGNGNKLVIYQGPLSRGFSPTPGQVASSGFTEISLPKFTVTMKGKVGEGARPETFYRTAPYPSAYFGQVFRELLSSVGIRVRGKLLRGETPEAASLLHVFESEKLAEILRDLNHYSNNFIGGQILFALGQDSVGYFRNDVAIERVGEYLTSIGVETREFVVRDGSGLDKGNRLTANALVRVLASAYDDFSIAPTFVSSLSRFGHSGTLRKRRLIRGRRQPKNQQRAKLADGVWGKTGTLNGVSSLAGYTETRDGRRVAYAIVINGRVGKSHAMSVENEIVRILAGIKRK